MAGPLPGHFFDEAGLRARRERYFLPLPCWAL